MPKANKQHALIIAIAPGSKKGIGGIGREISRKNRSKKKTIFSKGKD